MTHITIIATLKIPRWRITNVISLFLLHGPKWRYHNAIYNIQFTLCFHRQRIILHTARHPTTFSCSTICFLKTKDLSNTILYIHSTHTHTFRGNKTVIYVSFPWLHGSAVLIICKYVCPFLYEYYENRCRHENIELCYKLCDRMKG